MPMEAFSLTATTIPSSLTRRGATHKTSSHVNLSRHLHFMSFPSFAKHKMLSTRAQASGSTKCSAGKAEGIPEKTDAKDDDLVFVAGATGKVGSRTVRELIKLGFRVRAGVRSAQRAGALVQSVERLKLDATSGGSQAVEKLEIVECDLEKPGQIGPALGNASTVICSIGASEKEVFDITGPFRIDYQATKNLIDAATVAKVNHFILVTSLGTNKVGFPAAILNLFWGVLIWKRKAEEALLASGLPYTIVRPGGMERPTDAYKETHNITLSREDTLFGGQVSNLQIAELMAVMAKNRDLSYCKIVEVIAETTAPLTPLEKLLPKIPSQRPYVYSPKKPDIAAVNEPEPSANVVAAEPSIVTQEETTQPKPVAKQPLSPYTAYANLKPPSSPSPSKPSGGKIGEINETVATPIAPDTPSTEPVLDGISQTTSISEVKKSLSPYAAYEDLKPPTSPSPTPSSSSDKPLAASTEVESTGDNVAASTEVESTGDNVSASTEVESTGSNVAAPTEVESTGDNVGASTEVESTGDNVAASTEVESTGSNVAAPTEVESTGDNVAASTTVESTVGNVDEKNPSQDSNSSNSPYPVYSDFKPPTSPSPNAPNTSTSKSAVDVVPEMDAASSNGPAQLSIADESKDEEHAPEPKSRPLSPYTMYEDLKPPTSPTPSFRKS